MVTQVIQQSTKIKMRPLLSLQPLKRSEKGPRELKVSKIKESFEHFFCQTVATNSEIKSTSQSVKLIQLFVLLESSLGKRKGQALLQLLRPTLSLLDATIQSLHGASGRIHEMAQTLQMASNFFQILFQRPACGSLFHVLLP